LKQKRSRVYKKQQSAIFVTPGTTPDLERLLQIAKKHTICNTASAVLSGGTQKDRLKKSCGQPVCGQDTAFGLC
jgi:hypothetical protein